MRDSAKSKKALPNALSHKKKITEDIDGPKKSVKLIPTLKEFEIKGKKHSKNSEMSEESESQSNDEQKYDSANGIEEAKAAKTKLAKRVHLTHEQVNSKIDELEKRLAELSGPENAQKRKRTFKTITKLKAAVKNPDEFIVDPDQEREKLKMKKEKMVQKKIEKKRKKEENVAEEKMKMRKKICLICKKKGHIAEKCFQKPKDASLGAICFNCGSTEHSLNDCYEERIPGKLPFATCFHCNQKGHIGRDCADNPNGVYYKGGSCFICGSTRHLAKECDQRHQSTENRFIDTGINAKAQNDDVLEEEPVEENLEPTPKKREKRNPKEKVVKRSKGAKPQENMDNEGDE